MEAAVGLPEVQIPFSITLGGKAQDSNVSGLTFTSGDTSVAHSGLLTAIGAVGGLTTGTALLRGVKVEFGFAFSANSHGYAFYIANGYMSSGSNLKKRGKYMQIPKAEIEFKKKVGKSGSKEVWHYKTVGGLHVMAKDDGTILAAAPHRAVARHLAQKFDSDITWTELSKSDHYDVESFQHLLPEYEALSNAMRKMSK